MSNITTYQKEELLEKVKVLQQNLNKINKERRLIEDLIKKHTRHIDNLDDVLNLSRQKVNNHLKRDINICLDYINSHKHTHSSDLIKHLNKELKGQYTRWKGEIDSNRFMSIMGTHLQNHCKIEKVVYNGRKTTRWYI